MSARRRRLDDSTSRMEREVRSVLSEAASGPENSRNLLRGIERRCRQFLEEERWARITLRWAMVAGVILATLLLLERVGRQDVSPAPGPLAMDVGEYFQNSDLGESQVLTAVVVGEVPE